MFEFLQPSERPVIAELQKNEVVFAANQPEYNPLRVIVGRTDTRPVLSRWTLTMQQRAEVAAGADVYLELLTFGGLLQPIRMAIGVDVDPEFIREQYGLEDEEDE